MGDGGAGWRLSQIVHYLRHQEPSVQSFRKAFLRNGFRHASGPELAHLPQTDQCRQRALELPVEMDLIAPQPLELVGIESFAERLLANVRLDCNLVTAGFVPGENFCFEVRLQARNVGAVRRDALTIVIRLPSQLLRPGVASCSRGVPRAHPRMRGSAQSPGSPAP